MTNALNLESVKSLKAGDLIKLSFPPNSDEIGALNPDGIYQFKKISTNNNYLILEGYKQLCLIRWFSIHG